MQVFETSDELFEKINWRYFWLTYGKQKLGPRLTNAQRRKFEKTLKNFIPLPSKTMLALQKALSVGPQLPPGQLIKGSKLIVEPLDVTMKLVTFDDKKIKLHKDLINGKIKRKNKKRKGVNGRRKAKLRAYPSEAGFVRQIKFNKRSSKKSSIFSGRWIRRLLRTFSGGQGKTQSKAKSRKSRKKAK